MNLRHAATLALVGWYLMGPPILHPDENSKMLGLEAPLSLWETIDEFDSIKACKDERFRTEQNGFILEKETDTERAKNPVTGMTPEQMHSRAIELTLVRCVASDDPRLKEK